MPTPSIGRIVMAPMDPAKNNGCDEAPAIITRVWEGGAHVNVKVIGDNADPPEWRTSVLLYESRQVMNDATDQWANYPDPPLAVYWPARV